MKQLTSTQEKYREVAERLLWATQKDFTCWFTGEWKSWKRTEYNLPRMVEKDALTAVRHGKKFVYSAGKKRANNTADIEHGLISTQALLKFKLAREGEFISESFFRKTGFKSVPEWAVVYGKTILLFEYSTADNFRRTLLMKKKVNTYSKELQRFADFFHKDPIVLFVFDTMLYKVTYFVQKYCTDHRMYFCDLKHFLATENPLTASIYMSGMDGKPYPLTDES